MNIDGETRSLVATPVGAGFNAVLRAVLDTVVLGGRALARAMRAARHRRELAELAGFDDHMLRDIGISRSDLRDAVYAPLLSDPGEILISRAVERRAAARLAARAAALQGARTGGDISAL